MVDKTVHCYHVVGKASSPYFRSLSAKLGVGIVQKKVNNSCTVMIILIKTIHTKICLRCGLNIYFQLNNSSAHLFNVYPERSLVI